MQPTEEIKSKLSIVEVINGYVRLEKAGNYWKAPCPFHQERTPSFTVNEERNMWHCFGCNKGGDVFAFLMEIENISFREALEVLAQRAGVELPRYNQEKHKEEQSLKERLGEILELATRFYEKQLWEGEGKKVALPYLQKRGLSDESIKKFRLGYAPSGWRHAADFLQSKKFSLRELEQAGLILQKAGGGAYDRFRDRIMFPIENSFGKVIGYSARVSPGSDEQNAKYINTPETPLYHKSEVLYGIAHAKKSLKDENSAVLVEGNMDVIALHQAGFQNTVAVSGTALTVEQLRILKRYTKELKLFFDMDSAGQKAARKSTELALSEDLEVKLVTIEGGKDAADLAQENEAALARSIQEAKDAPEVFLEKLKAEHGTETASGKQNIITDFSSLLSHMLHQTTREHWIHELALALRVQESSLRADLQAFLRSDSRGGRSQEIPTVSPKNGSSKAEVLREEYITLLLTLPGAWKRQVSDLHETVKKYIEEHPLHFYIVQAGDKDIASYIQDPTLQGQVSTRLFGRLQKDEIKNLSEEDLRKARDEELQAIGQDLEDELVTKRRLQELEALLVSVRKEGNRDQEQELLEEFTRLSVRRASR